MDALYCHIEGVLSLFGCYENIWTCKLFTLVFFCCAQENNGDACKTLFGYTVSTVEFGSECTNQVQCNPSIQIKTQIEQIVVWISILQPVFACRCWLDRIQAALGTFIMSSARRLRQFHQVCAQLLRRVMVLFQSNCKISGYPIQVANFRKNLWSSNLITRVFDGIPDFQIGHVDQLISFCLFICCKWN